MLNSQRGSTYCWTKFQNPNRISVINVIIIIIWMALRVEVFGKFEVISSKPANGTFVKEGANLMMSCRSNVNWFFCGWNGPDGSKQCAIQQKLMPKSICNFHQRRQFTGEKRNCNVQIKNVRQADHGNWICAMSDPNFQLISQNLVIEVAVEAQVTFVPGFGLQNVLRMTEKNKKYIRCGAYNGHPPAIISWQGPPYGSINVTRSPVVKPHVGGGYTSDVEHVLQYTSVFDDNGYTIICNATQYDQKGSILFQKSLNVKLKIDKVVDPIDRALTQKIGIISGVLLAIIFLFILCTFIILAVCKRRRTITMKSTNSQTVSNTSSKSTIKPIWTTESRMMKRNGMGFVNEAIYDEMTEEVCFQNSAPDTLPLTVAMGSKRGKRIQTSSSSVNMDASLSHRISPCSQKTNITQSSSSSRSSWEENRSVGELQLHDTSIIRGKTPSLQETHFNDSEMMLDLITPVASSATDDLFNPNYYRHGYTARPCSSLADATIMTHHHPNLVHSSSLLRPMSSMSQPNTTYGNESMPNPLTYSWYRAPPIKVPMTSSGVSVFDCELGCFIDDEHQNDDNGGQKTDKLYVKPIPPTSSYISMDL